MNYIPYGRQNINDDDINAVIEVLKSDWLTQGPKVKEFEVMVAKYHNCKYAVAFCNGTAALHGAYYASGIKQGEEFITSPITFVATANAGLYCGGVPKFVDIDMKTYCIDIGLIEGAITEKTRVITPVSYAGYPVDVQAIKNLPTVKRNNICIIHDACHAIGARRDGNGIADFADMAVLSFHPVKHIACGEGGMVLTNNETFYKKLMLFRNHGITKNPEEFMSQEEEPWYYEMHELGFNYRLTDIQSTLGISQMTRLDCSIARRNEIASIYERELFSLDWMYLPPGFSRDWMEASRAKPGIAQDLHAYHLFPIRLASNIDKVDFYHYLRQNMIGTQTHYIPIHRQVYYTNNYMTDRISLPISEEFYKTELSVPMYDCLRDEELEQIIEAIRHYPKA